MKDIWLRCLDFDMYALYNILHTRTHTDTFVDRMCIVQDHLLNQQQKKHHAKYSHIIFPEDVGHQ